MENAKKIDQVMYETQKMIVACEREIMLKKAELEILKELLTVIETTQDNPNFV